MEGRANARVRERVTPVGFTKTAALWLLRTEVKKTAVRNKAISDTLSRARSAPKYFDYISPEKFDPAREKWKKGVRSVD